MTDFSHRLIRVHPRLFAGKIGSFQTGYLRFAPVVILFFIRVFPRVFFRALLSARSRLARLSGMVKGHADAVSG